MKLRLLRYSSGFQDSLGLLGVDGEFLCYTLEDEHREIKVHGETRIPAGTYRITLRLHGGFHQRYEARFPQIHMGMLWIRDVPDFTNILIHCGNTDEDTAGCILVGDTVTQNVTRKGFLASSRKAYERIYLLIARAADAGRAVIEIVDWGT